jgi:hypothetical protein
LGIPFAVVFVALVIIGYHLGLVKLVFFLQLAELKASGPEVIGKTLLLVSDLLFQLLYLCFLQLLFHLLALPDVVDLRIDFGLECEVRVKFTHLCNFVALLTLKSVKHVDQTIMVQVLVGGFQFALLYLPN